MSGGRRIFSGIGTSRRSRGLAFAAAALPFAALLFAFLETAIVAVAGEIAGGALFEATRNILAGAG